MGAVATALPWILGAIEMAPTLIRSGRKAYDGAVAIWEAVTANEDPTPEQRQQYTTAREAAFAALMKSTADVAEEGEET